MITDTSINGAQESKEVLNRMAYFAAQGSQDYISNLIEFLILHTLSKLPYGSHTPGEIKERLNVITGFKFEFEFVFQALRKLEKKKLVYARDTEIDTAVTFGIEPQQSNDLMKKMQFQREFEEKIFREWENELVSRYPDIEQEYVHQLKEDLGIYSKKLYEQHSIESVSLYFGEDKNAEELVNRIGGQSLWDIFPSREEKLVRIRSIELPRFFLKGSTERKQYIGQNLNQVFIHRMLSLDPTCAALMKEQITGGTLFLDTNILIRLFGIDGQDFQEATKRLLDLSKGLGYRCVVSPRTIEEYKYKITDFGYKAKNFQKVSPNIADAAISSSIGEDFLTYYWRRSKENKGYFSHEGFIKYYSQVENLIKEFGLEMEEEGDFLIRTNDVELAKEESLLRRSLPNYEAAHPSIVQHDAHHRLLILNLRQGYEGKKPLEVRHWFLTCDTKLPVYDKRARVKTGLTIPFCVLSTNWMQLLRPFASAVKGFEVSQATYLDSQLLRLFPAPPNELIQDVISRMTLHDEFPENFTIKMITDNAFMQALSDENNQETRDEILKEYVLDNAEKLIIQERNKFEEEKQSLLEQIQRLEQGHENLRSKSETLDDKLYQANENNEKYLSEKSVLESNVRDLQLKLDALNNDLKESRKQLRQDARDKEQLQESVNKLNIDISTLRNQAQEMEQRSKEETEKYTQYLERASLERDHLISSFDQERAQLLQTYAKEEQTRKQHRVYEQKTIAIVFVWIATLFLLVGLQPWTRDDSLKWLSLSLPLIALVATEFIVIWRQRVRALPLALLILLGLSVFIIAALLPFGVQIEAYISLTLAAVQAIADVIVVMHYWKSEVTTPSSV